MSLSPSCRIGFDPDCAAAQRYRDRRDGELSVYYADLAADGGGPFEKTRLHRAASESEKAIKTLWLSGRWMVISAYLHAGNRSRFAALTNRTCKGA